MPYKNFISMIISRGISGGIRRSEIRTHWTLSFVQVTVNFASLKERIDQNRTALIKHPIVYELQFRWFTVRSWSGLVLYLLDETWHPLQWDTIYLPSFDVFSYIEASERAESSINDGEIDIGTISDPYSYSFSTSSFLLLRRRQVSHFCDS